MEMQVPGLAIVQFQFRPCPGADEQRVDLAGRLVHRPGADRLEDAAQFRRHEAEAGRLLPGRFAPAAPRSTTPTAAVRSSASGGAYRRPRSSPGVSRFTRSTATLTTTSV